MYKPNFALADMYVQSVLKEAEIGDQADLLIFMKSRIHLNTM